MSTNEPLAAAAAASSAKRLRLAAAIAGIAVLAAAAVGIYFSTGKPATESLPASTAAGAPFREPASPRPVPEIRFQDASGGTLTLADFKGKTVLLNVWATWCVPCRQEMPALDRLQQKLGGPDFEVLALSIDAGRAAAVKQFYDEIGIRSLAIYVDPSAQAMASLATVGIPTTLLLDRQGREIGRRTGPAPWDAPEAVRMITGYME